MEHFLTEQLHVAFQTDAKLSSHPIVQTVSNSDEITAIFDVISYNKVTIFTNITKKYKYYITITNFDSRVHLYLEC